MNAERKWIVNYDALAILRPVFWPIKEGGLFEYTLGHAHLYINFYARSANNVVYVMGMAADLPDPNDTLRLLAAGLVLQHQACTRGAILDARDERGRTLTPKLLLRAQARLSRLQIASGELARADSLHQLVADCRQPLGDWAPAALLEGDPALAELVLIDPEVRSPTPECVSLGQEGQNLADVKEDVWFTKLRDQLRTVPLPKNRSDAYTRLRRFIVAHPVATQAELDELIGQLDADTLLPLLGPLVQEMYPALVTTSEAPLGRCGHCGSLIEAGDPPHCTSARCREEHREAWVRDQVDPTDVRVLRGELVLYWVNPGRDELRLFDRLSEHRDDVTLYPNQDEVDLGLGGERNIGLDLKDYASMPTLARRFHRELGGLAFYRRGIVVVTDRGTRVRGEARRDQLKEKFEELGIPLEVMTVHDVLEAFGGQA